MGPTKAALAALAASGGILACSERKVDSALAQTLSTVVGREAVQLIPTAAAVRCG